MSIVRTITRKWHTMTHTPRIFWRVFARTKLFSYLPDKWALKILYRNVFLTKLDLKNPKTFNEKLQWLKLYDRKPEYTMMVDKYKVREYIKEKIGEEYLIPLLGVWERAEDIDFDALPEQFVLKCNHGSGCNIICKDKSMLDRKKTIAQLNEWMHKDFYKIGREWPYKDVPRRITAEKYMIDERNEGQYVGTTRDKAINDYKFFCFDGEPKALFVATDRGVDTRFDFFDMDFQHLPFKQGHPLADKPIEKPECFDEMVRLAKKMSEGLPQVRVDFYSINGRVYFGELTFSHYSGFTPFEPEEWDNKFGEWIKIPINSRGGYLLIDFERLTQEENAPDGGLTDYKVLCFNGEPKLIEVHQGRFTENHTQEYYDTDWELTEFRRPNKPRNEVNIEKPKALEEMLLLTKRLVVEIPSVRVDWYCVGAKLYFGEITLFNGSGFLPFPEGQDEQLGEWIHL